MPALTDYLSRRGEVLILALMVVLSLGLMFLSSGGKLSVAHAVNEVALTPVQGALSDLGGFVGLRAENDSLRAALLRSRFRLADAEERAGSADRLARMLDLRDRSRFDLVSARVIAWEAGRVSRELKIDRGSRDGVQRNMAVVTVDGLVGRVSAVEPTSAFVRPLTGRHCRVSARLDRTRSEGVLGWSPEHGLHLTFLPLRTEVQAGDPVVSSGLGDVFPAGIPIGTVREIQVDRTAGTTRVTVDAAVDFARVEEIFVVTGQSADQDRPGEEAPDELPAEPAPPLPGG